MTTLGWLIRPIAHRGLHNAANGIVENSSSAFGAAIDAGYAIETDVQTSADGEVMVFHDAVLDRLTTDRGPVAARTAADLQKLPIGGTSDRMQTLAELLEQVGGQVPLVIEIKSSWKDQGALERRIAQALASYKGHAAVMSFDPRCIAALASQDPEIPRGVVAEKFTDMTYWHDLSMAQRFALRHLISATIAKPQFIAYDIKALPALAPWLAGKLWRLPLLTWTVRTDAERQKAERWADAIIFEGFRP